LPSRESRDARSRIKNEKPLLMKKDSNLNADKPEGNKSSIKNSRNENEEI